ncbi:Uncharacterized protein Fot_56730 [Forsythia ovata]|uniref:Uncharacterized protein n=1 Tax=Forsythia ovata TaxID=205694 RepID=A0ABD1NYK9_9LAMI
MVARLRGKIRRQCMLNPRYGIQKFLFALHGSALHSNSRENTKQFTIAWHYGGRFFVKPNNLKYEHGKVEYMDFVEVDDFKKLTVYVVGSVLGSPARTFVLSWESPTVKWKTNVVIEEIVEPESIRVPESQPLSGEEPPIDEESEDAYVPQSEEQEWDGVNWEELIDGVCSGQWDEELIDSFVHRSGQEELRPDCEDQGNVSGRPEHSDHIGASENVNLVDSDYESNEENKHESQLTAASPVNIDMSGSINLEDNPLPQTNIKHQLTRLRWQARKRLPGFRSVHEVFTSKGSPQRQVLLSIYFSKFRNNVVLIFELVYIY